jgi:hypothetical protein
MMKKDTDKRLKPRLKDVNKVKLTFQEVLTTRGGVFIDKYRGNTICSIYRYDGKIKRKEWHHSPRMPGQAHAYARDDCIKMLRHFGLDPKAMR